MAQETDVRDAPAAPGSGVPAEISDDARIGAVLAVLRGATVEATARQYSVDHTLLQRWVGAFVEAGAAKVNNKPDPRAAAHRDRFLAAFAFEMRAPLTTSLGWVGMLTAPEPPEGGFIGVSRKLETSLTELAARVADVELLVAAALGGLTVHPERVTLGELVVHLDGLDPHAIRGKGPDLEIEVDPALFARVLGDLWDLAALDPAPRARRLMVSVVGPWVDIRVLRDADPIDTDVLQALFEPFDAEHLTTGVTTGLYLARALVVAHGGTVGVDQDESGAALWVRVPHRPDKNEPAPAPHSGGSR